MSKITAFFGGSFDPPHSGHLGVAHGALRSGRCSKVIWVPSWSQPHKQGKKSAPFEHRLAMVEMLINKVPGMAASDIENRLKLQPSYTFEVLKYFAEELPDDEQAALLIGGDSLLALHTWYKAEELAEKYLILTYPRGVEISSDDLRRHWGAKETEKLLSGVLDGGFFEISSTNIRNSMVKSPETCNINNDDRKTPDVIISEYCKKHGLY